MNSPLPEEPYSTLGDPSCPASATSSNSGPGGQQVPEVRPTVNYPPFPVPLTSIERFHWFDDEPAYPNVIFARLAFETHVDSTLAQRAWQLVLQDDPLANVEPYSERTWWGGVRWIWRSLGNRTKPVAQWAHSRVELSSEDVATDISDAGEANGGPSGLELPKWSLDRHPCPSATGCYLGIHARAPQQDAADQRSDSGSAVEPDSARPAGSHRTANRNELPRLRQSNNQKTIVTFYIHHAVADGIASLRVMNHWITIYNNLVAGRDPHQGVHRIDPQQFSQRNRLGLLRWSYLRNLPFQVVALFGAAKFMFRKTARLQNTDSAKGVPGSETRSTTGFPAIVDSWVSPKTTEAIYQTAKRNSVSANSILLAQWFRSLGDWRAKRQGGKGQQQEWLRVILPISIRTIADRRLPSANRTAIVQIDRRVPAAKDLPEFYRLLHREIKIIVGWQLEKMFLIMIRLFSCSNWLLKRIAANPASRGLSVFTDLGRPFQATLKQLRRHSGSPAIRSDNCATVDAKAKTDTADLPNANLQTFVDRGEVWLHEGNDVGEPQLTPEISPVDFWLVGPIRRGTPLNLSLSRFEDRIKLCLHYDANCLSRADAVGLLSEFEANLQSLSDER